MSDWLVGCLVGWLAGSAFVDWVGTRFAEWFSNKTGAAPEDLALDEGAQAEAAAGSPGFMGRMASAYVISPMQNQVGSMHALAGSE